MAILKRTIGVAMILCFAWASPSSAHHSFAMFNQSKQTVIDGIVNRFVWTNPHVFIFIDVPSNGGERQRYVIEAASINMLARKGWRVSSLRASDRVRVTFNPLKNGENGGLLIRVQRPDGTILEQ